ncbi:TIGR03118 family protein [Geotalea daltonii]|uniref:TIGR03118 family protein n=1 Tax=Geotalea daltonii TaxID=1203471 RepID=UPI0000DCAEAF|nr:TIGR03118 family protein [Geotalea daltonii]
MASFFNFKGGSIDVFDSNFKPVTLATDAFTDNKIPAGFAPFNVMNISGRLFVTYAKRDADKHDDVAGAGNGFVDIFDPNGTLLQRLETGKWLNSPWGVALAPADFGKFSNRLLIGNFGSGQIAAYNAETGKFLDLLQTSDGKALAIEGLWGLEFGNGKAAGPINTLFFAAGFNGEKDGLFGTITPTSK